MKPELRRTLEYVVEQLNKPEALAKYRAEIARGQASAHAHYEKQKRERRAICQAIIDKLTKDAHRTLYKGRNIEGRRAIAGRAGLEIPPQVRLEAKVQAREWQIGQSLKKKAGR
jgi:hypothetical protein